MGTLQAFIAARRKEGVKSKSINLALGLVRPATREPLFQCTRA